MHVEIVKLVSVIKKKNYFIFGQVSSLIYIRRPNEMFFQYVCNSLIRNAQEGSSKSPSSHEVTESCIIGGGILGGLEPLPHFSDSYFAIFSI